MVTTSISLICANNLFDDISYLSERTEYFHFDIMDTDFSMCEGLNPLLIHDIKKMYQTKIDAHIMAMYPQKYVDLCISYHTDIITIHVESEINVDAYINCIKAAGLMVGIAITPQTALSRIYQYLQKVDIINVLTVEPGPSGQQFQQQQLIKVEELKKIRSLSNLKYMIEIDGSCNAKNYPSMKQAGADIVVVGTSGLFSLNPDIVTAWQEMIRYMT